jgi:hypothetical protein
MKSLFQQVGQRAARDECHGQKRDPADLAHVETFGLQQASGVIDPYPMQIFHQPEANRALECAAQVIGIALVDRREVGDAQFIGVVTVDVCDHVADE